MKPDEVCKRLATLQTERNNLDSLYQLIERYVRPFTGEFFSTSQGELSVDWRSRQLFDSTAIVAANQLASSIHGSLTPPLIKWLNLVFQDEELNQNQEAAEWLQECADICYQALQESDFHLEMNKVYLDLVSWGIAFPIEEETEEGSGDLNFTCSPMKSTWFEDGEDGQPRALYRELKWSPSQCVDKFGADCPPAIVEKLDNGKLTDKETIVFVIWKRDITPIDASKPIAASQRLWGYQYVYVKGKERIGEEGGYYERPVFAPKWMEHSDSKFGLSPSMRAMPDILSLNQLVEVVLTAAEKAIDPPLLAEEAGIFSDIDLKAGGLTMVRSLDDSLRPLNIGGSFDVSQLIKSDLVNAVRSAFHADDLQLKESPAMTATETMARMELMQRVLGATFGYLKSYMLDPIIERTFAIQFRAGKLPEPPEIVTQSSAEMDVEYLGTLARAQKRDEVDAIQGFLQDVSAIAQVFPAALDVPDVDKFIRRAADARNIPKELMRGDEEVMDRRQEKEMMMKRREQLEQEQIAADTGATALQALDGGRQQ